MHPIHLVKLDKIRPAVLLTRDAVRPYRTWVTIAPITTTVRGLGSEVRVGPDNGLDHASVINCDNITTVPTAAVGKLVGQLTPEQEATLAITVIYALELDAP